MHACICTCIFTYTYTHWTNTLGRKSGAQDQRPPWSPSLPDSPWTLRQSMPLLWVPASPNKWVNWTRMSLKSLHWWYFIPGEIFLEGTKICKAISWFRESVICWYYPSDDIIVEERGSVVHSPSLFLFLMVMTHLVWHLIKYVM